MERTTIYSLSNYTEVEYGNITEAPIENNTWEGTTRYPWTQYTGYYNSTTDSTDGTDYNEAGFPTVPVAVSSAAGVVLILVIVVMMILAKRGLLHCECCQSRREIMRRPSMMPTMVEIDEVRPPSKEQDRQTASIEIGEDWIKRRDSKGIEYYEHPDGRIYYHDVPKSEQTRKSTPYQYARFRSDEEKVNLGLDNQGASLSGGGYSLEQHPQKSPKYDLVQQSQTYKSSAADGPSYSLATQSTSQGQTDTTKSVSFQASERQACAILDVPTKSRTLPAPGRGDINGNKRRADVKTKPSNKHLYQNYDEIHKALESGEVNAQEECISTTRPPEINEKPQKRRTYVNICEVEEMISNIDDTSNPTDYLSMSIAEMLRRNLQERQVTVDNPPVVESQELDRNFPNPDEHEEIYENTLNTGQPQEFNGNVPKPSQSQEINGNVPNPGENVRKKKRISVFPPDMESSNEMYENNPTSQRPHIEPDYSDTESIY